MQGVQRTEYPAASRLRIRFRRLRYASDPYQLSIQPTLSNVLDRLLHILAMTFMKINETKQRL